MNCLKTPLVLASVLLAFGACTDRNSNSSAGEVRPLAAALGEPLPGLTAEELAAFDRGKLIFQRRFKPTLGLGPLYNATSCSSCHSTPVVGGSADLYRNFYIATAGFFPEFQFNLPGLPSPVVPAFGSVSQDTFTLEGGRVVVGNAPPGVSITSAQRNSIPIFGVGLFELISDATILANADPDDMDGDGISGRINNDGAGVGRFGLKAQSNNIELFTRAPLQNQMGITSDPFEGSGGTVKMSHSALLQASSNPNVPTTDDDGFSDPEISAQDLGDLIAFSRFLAPPPRARFDATAVRGLGLFDQIGCAKCHIPSLESSRGPVEAYTDLLIHNMGPDLADNISFGRPQSSSISTLLTWSEFRTQPLWGISQFGPFLHDGRANTLDEAIRMHGGEAAGIRDAYAALSQVQRDDILAFLRQL